MTLQPDQSKKSGKIDIPAINESTNLKYLQQDIQRAVTDALEEDIKDGDITAMLVDKTANYKAKVISREDATICGVAWVNQTFMQVNKEVIVKWFVKDGSKVKANETLFEVEGNAQSILTAERTALNFLQMLSGTATLSEKYAKQVEGTQTRILDTRKTIPGLRSAQKYAVSCGGCFNHRIGLFDAYLIKENHIAACGSITQAISTAKQNSPNKSVEIEVESLKEFSEALKAKADIIMLDNFSLEDMHKAVEIKKSYNSQTLLEASGNMSIENLREVANTGVDFISTGSLTKNVRAVDLSMRFIDQ